MVLLDYSPSRLPVTFPLSLPYALGTDSLSGINFPHSSRKRLNGSEITALSRTPTSVRDTADQVELRPSIPGTAIATRITGKNRMAIASARIPWPPTLRFFHRLAVSNARGAAGVQPTPRKSTTGRGNSSTSSERSSLTNAAVQKIIITASASINRPATARCGALVSRPATHREALPAIRQR